MEKSEQVDLLQEKSKLLEEFDKHFDAVRDFYTNVTLEATEKFFQAYSSDMEGFPRPEKFNLVFVVKNGYKFYSNGGKYFRLDISRYADEESGTSKDDVIGIITPDDVYTLQNVSGNYALSGQGKPSSSFSQMLHSYYFHSIPYSYIGEDFRSLLFSPKTTIQKITRAGELDLEMITFFLSVLTPKEDYAEFEISFYRNKSWALAGLKSKVPVNALPGLFIFRSFDCVYQEKSDNGVPFLEKVVFKMEKDRNGKFSVTEFREYEINKITPGAAPLSEFEVNQFISKIGQQKSTNFFRMTCMLIGLLLMIIGIGLKIYKKKGEK
jgi:hypothetical protein